MKYLLTTLVFLFTLGVTFSNNLEFTNVSQSGSVISFDIEWDNSWKSGSDFRDAVWIFIKQQPNGGPSWQHTSISSIQPIPGFTTIIPSDQTGFILERLFNLNGTASTTVVVTATGLLGQFQDLKVMGVEMVYIPQEQFFAGDGSSVFRIARGDDVTKPVRIDNNNALSCGNTINDIQFHNWACNDYPEEYPEGYSSFYCMKYHITQGQYVDFLNCIPREFQELHVNTDITGTSITNDFVMMNLNHNGSYHNGIKCDTEIGTGNIEFYCDWNDNGIPNENGDGQGRPCNYMSTYDWMAYLDWSGLRPMSFLEVEKASRGPLIPVPGEKCWGSTLWTDPSTIINEGTANEAWATSTIDGGLGDKFGTGPMRVGCNAPLFNSDRERANAGYYGVIDLGNNMADFFIHHDHPSYEEIHGDGELSSTGQADVASWPDLDPTVSQRIKNVNSTIGISSNGLTYIGRNSNGTGRGVRSSF